MKQRKVPLRKCVVTKEQFEKKELIRVVRDKEGIVSVDATGKMNGRGAYLKKDKNVIMKAKKSNVLAKHLGVEINENVYEELLKLVTD